MNSIYNVEITSKCQNSCEYCPHKELVRGKRDQHMGYKVWRKCIYWLERLNQETVCLNGFGEPLLHPSLFEFIRELNEIGISPYFSTNGELFTEEIAKRLGEIGVDYISISPHSKRVNETIDDIIKSAQVSPGLSPYYLFSDKYPIPISISDGFRRLPHTWAGQTGEILNPRFGWPCEFIPGEKCTILSDGTVAQCCIDAEPSISLGNIMDVNLETLKSKKMPMCDKCHQNGGVV